MPSKRTPHLTTIGTLGSLLIGAAALAISALPAAAADTTCRTMMLSFDRVVADGGAAAKVAEAKKSRKAGAVALAKGNEKACRSHLEQAKASIVAAQDSMAIEEPKDPQ